MLAKVNITKTEGAVGVYDEQFMEMERKLMVIKSILDHFNRSAADMSSVDIELSEIRYEVQVSCTEW